MQGALALGLANSRPGARRAYQMGGRLQSNTSSASPVENEAAVMGGSGADFTSITGVSVQEGAVLGGSSYAYAPMALSRSSESNTPTITGSANTAAASPIRAGTLLGGKNKRVSLEINDAHVFKRGDAVDKTNPFIGYFQMSAAQSPETPKRSTSVVNLAAIAAATGNQGRHEARKPYYASMLFPQQASIANWMGVGASDCLREFDKHNPLWLKTIDGTMKLEDKAKPSYEEKRSALDRVRDFAGTTQIQEETSDTEESDESLKVTCSQEPSAIPVTTEPSRFEQDFEMIASLGKGGQGAVYKVRSKVDGREYAVKQVKLPTGVGRDSVAFAQALREVTSMSSMPPHQNIVRYHTAWIEESVAPATLEVPTTGLKSATKEIKPNTEITDCMSESGDSFSLGASSDFMSFDQSNTAGFDFAESSVLSEESVASREGSTHTGSVKSQKSSSEPLTALTVYIQMELCSTPVMSEPAEEEEPFGRFFRRLSSQDPTLLNDGKSSSKQVTHLNFASWLRSSAEERSAWSTSAAKHQEGLKLFFGVVQGVQHMHSCGVIHRDLKPDNILLDGTVAKIGDFGLSKSVYDSVGLPHARRNSLVPGNPSSDDHTTALGTFTYASPEQLGNSVETIKSASHVRSAKYSIKSDIFALGVILMEICCPFGTMMERSQVLTAVRHGVIPQRALREYPAEMALVLNMTAMDPAER